MGVKCSKVGNNTRNISIFSRSLRKIRYFLKRCPIWKVTLRLFFSYIGSNEFDPNKRSNDDKHAEQKVERSDASQSEEPEEMENMRQRNYEFI